MTKEEGIAANFTPASQTYLRRAMSQPDGNVHVMPTHGSEHEETKDCWCEPELIEDCTSNGGKQCWLHREIQ